MKFEISCILITFNIVLVRIEMIKLDSLIWHFIRVHICNIRPLYEYVHIIHKQEASDLLPHEITEVCEVQYYGILEASLEEFRHLTLLRH
jgi:hypothetical protein